MLPAKFNIARRKGKPVHLSLQYQIISYVVARIFKGTDPSDCVPRLDDDIEVPEDVEIVLEQLFQSLQDKVPATLVMDVISLSDLYFLRIP